MTDIPTTHTWELRVVIEPGATSKDDFLEAIDDLLGDMLERLHMGGGYDNDPLDPGVPWAAVVSARTDFTGAIYD